MIYPFTSGAANYPPHRAGRDTSIARCRKHLQRATKTPHHFVLPRLQETGKTVLPLYRDYLRGHGEEL